MINRGTCLYQICFIILLFGFLSCGYFDVKEQLVLRSGGDRDIVLINIGHHDRGTLGEQLLKIDSCKPKLIVFRAFFPGTKEPSKDSILREAFIQMDNDILSYSLEEGQEPIRSHNMFENEAAAIGLSSFKKTGSLVTKLPLIISSDGKTHKNLALVVAEKWKGKEWNNARTRTTISINYYYTSGQYNTFHLTDIGPNFNSEFLKDKIIIIGYLGPDNEDCHFTPLRFTDDYQKNQADTYGPVILANAIRTIVEAIE